MRDGDQDDVEPVAGEVVGLEREDQDQRREQRDHGDRVEERRGSASRTSSVPVARISSVRLRLPKTSGMTMNATTL